MRYEVVKSSADYDVILETDNENEAISAAIAYSRTYERGCRIYEGNIIIMIAHLGIIYVPKLGDDHT